VMYADMVGYSRLIGLDDAGTLERLRALRANLIDPALEQHGGRIVQTGGDSLLVVFDSIDGAVRCAVKVRERCQFSIAISRRTRSSAFGLE
jgi:adenylate cyclase